MEEDLVQSLQEVGYEGPLIDIEKLNQALDKGAKSVDFTGLVSWLTKQLASFGNLDEDVHPTASPEDSSTFLLELSSFLKELGCVNSQLTTGNVNQRLASRQERILLLEFLIVELMASKINYVKNPDTAKMQLTIYESDTAKALKDMLIALQFGKPPDNISVDQLFKKLEDKLKTIVSSASADLLGKPLIIGELSNSQWEKLDEYQKDMVEEYRIRREMLLKRLDVTIQSFLWSDRIKKKEDEVNYCYREKRQTLVTEPSVTISQLLAARDDVAIIEKTSSASVRKNTKSDVTKVIIGDVPDRGGRANEQAPPPPEMPSWQKDRVQGPGGGGRGGRGGRGGGGGGEGGRGGRGGGGGGRGGYNKDASTNFGQNRDWQNSSQSTGGSYQDNRGGGYQGGGGGGGLNYQNNRSGDYQRGSGNSSGGGGGSNYQSNKSGDYQRGGGNSGGGGGAFYQDNRSGGGGGASYQDYRSGGGSGYQDNRTSGTYFQDNRSGDYQQGGGSGGGGRDSSNSGYNRGRGGRVQSGWSQGGGGGGGGYNRGGNRSHY